jgi:type II secretory pathway pseudopilin PulG
MENGFAPNPVVTSFPSQSKTSGMAIAGLVLSIIQCIPPLPLVGLILGIVALVQIEKQPQALKGKGLAIAAIAMGVIGTLIVPGMMAAVAIPAFTKYIRRAKTSEAEDRISEMFRSATSYYTQEQVSRGSMTTIPPQFPVSSALTPPGRCCENPDGRCLPNPDQWDTPTWQALNFAISEPHYFQYQFISDGQGFTARALGDLDCDGIYSTFERAGMVNAHGDVEGTRGIFRNLPTE